jgi:hypothetical protein
MTRAYPGISETDLGDLKCNLAWAAVDEVRIVRSIPVDARHNAKVNYPKLIVELQKNNALLPRGVTVGPAKSESKPVVIFTFLSQ